MQRVIVLGPPGSGKSTLARRLGARHGLPVFHLDKFFHRPGWQPGPADEFRAEAERIAALPAWVIDGNYKGTIASRFARADTLVYLDMPSWLTMARIVRRIATDYGRVRVDSAAGCPERIDLEFLRFAWNWNRASRAKTHALVGTFTGRAIVLRGRREQMRFDREQFGHAGQGATAPAS
ncbi:MAG: hypothetical protein ACRYGP_10670 [Janthinobacterium lividum]